MEGSHELINSLIPQIHRITDFDNTLDLSPDLFLLLLFFSENNKPRTMFKESKKCWYLEWLNTCVIERELNHY